MNLINRVKNILLSPNIEWLVIKSENDSLNSLLKSYILPLSLIPAAASLLSGLLWSYYFSTAIKGAVIAVISFILTYYIGAYVTDALAPTFSSEKNINRSAQLTAYSLTAIAVASIISIIPGLGFLSMIAGFGYAGYIMFLGAGPIKLTPEDKKIGYVIASILIQLVISYIIATILNRIFFNSYYYYSY